MESLIPALNEVHYAMGYSVSADDVCLALRGVRTLPIRMREVLQMRCVCVSF